MYVDWISRRSGAEITWDGDARISPKPARCSTSGSGSRAEVAQNTTGFRAPVDYDDPTPNKGVRRTSKVRRLSHDRGHSSTIWPAARPSPAFEWPAAARPSSEGFPTVVYNLRKPASEKE